jgi:hypothetical protein
MLPRSLVMTLLLALLTAAARAPAQSKNAPGKKTIPIVTTSTVYYREKDSSDWSLWGYYSSEASARRVFEHLARTGYVAELRISNQPIPKLPPSRPDALVRPIEETVTYQKAVEVFKQMASRNDIAFRYPVDGCYARAQLMVESMLKQGLTPYKIWSVANGEELFAKTKNHPRGYVTWAYHVAPVLRVQNKDNSQRWYVIDPSLAMHPMTVSQWENAQKKTPTSPRPYMTVTVLGNGPKWIDSKRKAGHGYWPGKDPVMKDMPPEMSWKDRVHLHAVATMKKYKPWEGKAPPKATTWAPEREKEMWEAAALHDFVSVKSVGLRYHEVLSH